MSEYHHLLVVDNNYLFYLFVTLQSVLNNLEDKESNDQDQLVFHVLTDHSLNYNKATEYTTSFYELNADSKVKFSVAFHEISPEIFAHCNKMVNAQGHDSYSTYYRLLFAQALPADIHRVLYLDIDLYVNSDVRNIFERYPMQDEVFYATAEPFYLSSAVDPVAAEPVRMLFPIPPQTEPYLLKIKDSIQAGVLLINVDQWRQQHIEQQCLETALQWRLDFHDQDILSMVCHDKISYLDWDCNMVLGYFWFLYFGGWTFQDIFFSLEQLPVNNRPTQEQLQEMCNNPKIFHFAGDFKPWKQSHKLSELEQDFFQYRTQYANKWLLTYAQLAKHFKQKAS